MIYAILNSPQLPENTGMSIRALVNTGCKNLRIVNPKHSWPNKNAFLASAETHNLLNIEIFKDLKSALSDINFSFATSARPRNLIKEIYSPETFAEEIIEKSRQNIAIVFGCEKSGLTNEEISMCNGVIEIPSVNFSSYNLAQAVLIIFYQILVVKSNSKKYLKTGKTKIATHEELENFYKNLDNHLTRKNYFPDSRKHILMMTTIRNIFSRIKLTSQKIKSLFGIFLVK